MITLPGDRPVANFYLRRIFHEGDEATGHSDNVYLRRFHAGDHSNDMTGGMIFHMRRSEQFDPISVEQAMVERRVLPPRPDPPAGPLAELERHFTENDRRKYALWRISMVRQFQPAVLKRLSDDDLLYLAGQSPEGYSGAEAYGVQLDRNKIAQNALRTRVELEIRPRRVTWRQSVMLALASLVIGALLSTLLTAVA